MVYPCFNLNWRLPTIKFREDLLGLGGILANLFRQVGNPLEFSLVAKKLEQIDQSAK